MLAPTNAQVVHVHTDVSGTPMVTPDGTLLAVLNARQNRVHLLAIGNAVQQADDAAVKDVNMAFRPGGLSKMEFVEQVRGWQWRRASLMRRRSCMHLRYCPPPAGHWQARAPGHPVLHRRQLHPW